MVLNGNDLSRIHFISIIDHAVKEICTEDLVKKAFEATGVIPYDPSRIELSNFPSSSSSCESETLTKSPIKALCQSCLRNNVDLHPLVTQGVIPRKLANVFTYTPPQDKSKTQCKTIQNARCITSETVREEVAMVEQRKEEKSKGKSWKGKKKAEKI